MATATVEPTTMTPRKPARSTESDNRADVPPTKADILKLMRKPFEPHQISTMCKSTKKDNPAGRCNACGGWHKLPAVQISYVGHAALTDRLLDADPEWTWEPLAYAPNGTPLLDADGGMWIKLTVGGITRLGYGDAQGKTGGDATKERIGDALRNAAMRFGAALELWHKGTLHLVEESKDEEPTKPSQQSGSTPLDDEYVNSRVLDIMKAESVEDLSDRYKGAYKEAHAVNDKAAMARYITAKDARKKEL